MKRIKIHIVKFVAIVISVIYMLMPIHKEVKSVLHSMSHYLQMPDMVLSHNQDQNLNYKTQTSNITFHQHKLIDLLDAFIGNKTNNEDSNKAHIFNIKIDKHFYDHKYKYQELISTKTSSIIDNYKEKIKDEFFGKIKVPPKIT
ncbi:hypothetical protein GCM10023311_00410 [Flaviramulus aquimarinus]|uniref:Uncharacterized protein n=1 Tax=Flaviramulus aquimarinus TaxID=1170456 RepID=A0ABP9ENB3_9FLAO